MTSTFPPPSSADFARFDRRAQEGESLQVVFLGGSLTWGARATDPQLTSYRALVGQRLRDFYPKARFTFWDAAIGGTTSQLAAFRLQRDVLRRKPDLVFIDFSVNDGAFDLELERLASYESLVRRVILEAGAPVVQMILGLKQDLAATPKQPRPIDRAHKEISLAYQTGMGDAATWMRNLFLAGNADPDQCWPYFPDVTHPGDKGYALYAEAAWNGFREAVDQGKVCRGPEKMLHPGTYMNWVRQPLCGLKSPRKGWKTGLPHAMGSAFDFYMSRWLDDVTIAAWGADPIRLEFQGSMVLLFGEATTLSGQLRAKIDGEPATGQNPDGIYKAHCAQGNMHWVPVLAQGLDPAKKHLLELFPVLTEGQELRIESICVAGAHGASIEEAI